MTTIYRLCFALLLLCTTLDASFLEKEWRGVDVSLLPLVEAAGGILYDEQNRPRPLPVLLKQAGINLAQIHLWHSPTSGCCNLTQALKLAKRLTVQGIDIFLDFHYSDSWTDPSQQTIPAAWANYTFTEVKIAVRDYTRNVMEEFYKRDIHPVAVQLGNEIAGGMLWPYGKTWGKNDTTIEWAQFGLFLKNAKLGLIQAASSSGKNVPAVCIHNENGASFGATEWFFDNLIPSFDAFDVIALSYYPWYNKGLGDLEYNLEQLASAYGKDLAVVETAYPWTMGDWDSMGNFVQDANSLLPGYPASEQGQVKFILKMRDILRKTPGGRGIVYWSPNWISTPAYPSPWENLALFDEHGKVLNGLKALGGNITTTTTQEDVDSGTPSSEPSSSMTPSSQPSALPSNDPSRSIMPSSGPTSASSVSRLPSRLPSSQPSNEPSLRKKKSPSPSPK